MIMLTQREYTLENGVIVANMLFVSVVWSVIGIYVEHVSKQLS